MRIVARTGDTGPLRSLAPPDIERALATADRSHGPCSARIVIRVNERQRIRARRQYLSLGLGEFVAAAVFAVGAAMAVVPRMTSSTAVAALWSALFPLLLVLVQAGAYWLLARGWVGIGPMPSTLARLYRVFQVMDPLLLIAGLVGMVIWWPDDLWVAVLVLAVWVFGVIEYLNYFAIRLSYPASEWLAKVRQRNVPRLVKDLRPANHRTQNNRAPSATTLTSRREL
jgi:hypothetical protein